MKKAELIDQAAVAALFISSFGAMARSGGRVPLPSDPGAVPAGSRARPNWKAAPATTASKAATR